MKPFKVWTLVEAKDGSEAKKKAIDKNEWLCTEIEFN